MNAAIFRKTARDGAVLLIALTLAVVLFEVFFLAAIRQLSGELQNLLTAQTFVRYIIRSLVGADLIGDITPTALATVGLAHPVLYAFTWTVLLTAGTRVLCGEVEQGTADVLLSLPVSRAAIYASVSAWLAVCAASLSAAPLAGLWIAQHITPLSAPLEMGRLAQAAANLLLLNLAVASMTLMLSAHASRRSHVIFSALGVLLGSFLLSFLAQFWSVAQHVAWLGLLHYYRPLPIVQSGEWPVPAMAVLAGLALVCWVVGLARFTNRDVQAA